MVNNKPLELEVKRNRLKCPKCGKVMIENLGKIKLSNGHNKTQDYDELVLQRLSTSPTISATAKEFKITDSKIRNIILSNTNKEP